MSGRPSGGDHTAAPPWRARGCALAGRLEDRVGRGVGGAGAVAADGLDAGGDEAVAFAGLDRVRRHADRLQARRAVAVDGHARRVETGEDRHDAGDVEAGLAGRLAATHDQVLDRARRDLRHLGHQRLHDLGRHVVGAEVDERALDGTPDRAAGGGDDHGFCHASSVEALPWLTRVRHDFRLDAAPGSRETRARDRCYRNEHDEGGAHATPRRSVTSARPVSTTRSSCSNSSDPTPGWLPAGTASSR